MPRTTYTLRSQSTVSSTKTFINSSLGVGTAGSSTRREIFRPSCDSCRTLRQNCTYLDPEAISCMNCMRIGVGCVCSLSDPHDLSGMVISADENGDRNVGKESTDHDTKGGSENIDLLEALLDELEFRVQGPKVGMTFPRKKEEVIQLILQGRDVIQKSRRTHLHRKQNPALADDENGEEGLDDNVLSIPQSSIQTISSPGLHPIPAEDGSGHNAARSGPEDERIPIAVNWDQITLPAGDARFAPVVISESEALATTADTLGDDSSQVENEHAPRLTEESNTAHTPSKPQITEYFIVKAQKSHEEKGHPYQRDHAVDQTASTTSSRTQVAEFTPFMGPQAVNLIPRDLIEMKQDGSDRDIAGGPVKTARRPPGACLSCKRLKVKCVFEPPDSLSCKRCTKNGRECDIRASLPRRKTPTRTDLLRSIQEKDIIIQQLVERLEARSSSFTGGWVSIKPASTSTDPVPKESIIKGAEKEADQTRNHPRQSLPPDSDSSSSSDWSTSSDAHGATCFRCSYLKLRCVYDSRNSSACQQCIEMDTPCPGYEGYRPSENWEQSPGPTRSELVLSLQRKDALFGQLIKLLETRKDSLAAVSFSLTGEPEEDMFTDSAAAEAIERDFRENYIREWLEKAKSSIDSEESRYAFHSGVYFEYLGIGGVAGEHAATGMGIDSGMIGGNPLTTLPILSSSSQTSEIRPSLVPVALYNASLVVHAEVEVT